MIDKNQSMSSFLALRYTEKSDVDFTEKLSCRHPQLPKADERIFVHTAQDISDAIEKQLIDIRGVSEDRYPAFGRYGCGNPCIIPVRL